MNGVRISTMIVSAKRAARVDRGRRSFFSDVACQNTKANLSLLHICIRQIVCSSNFGV